MPPHHRRALAGSGASAFARFDPTLDSFALANDGTTDLVVLLDGVSHTLTGGAAANQGDVLNGGHLESFAVVSGGAWRFFGEYDRRAA